MVAEEANDNRAASAKLIRENPDWLMGEFKRLTEGPTLFAPKRHPVLDVDVNLPRLRRIVETAHEENPQDFEALLGVAGLGPATIRSLALLAEIIFQAPVSRRDPASVQKSRGKSAVKSPTFPANRKWADYSFTHGGKDGTPFAVDRETYDRNVNILTEAVRRARVGDNEKFQVLRRISKMSE